jgi:CP family cyanate transporter-like MFS transporter
LSHPAAGGRARDRVQGVDGGGRDALRRGAAAVLVIGIICLGLNLRAAITSLPPVFPELSAQLGLSVSAITVLATVPVLCFGLFSGVAAPLSRRFGEERVLLASLSLVAAGLVLRGALPRALLYPGTVLACGAIALMNVLLPSMIKRRQPSRAGLLIGVYLLSLSVGSVLGSLLAVPAYQYAAHAPWLGGSVRFSLWMWAVPAAVAFVVWLPQGRYRTGAASVPGPPAAPGAGPPAAAGARPGIAAGAVARIRRRPGLPPGRIAVTRHALAWQVTAFMGLQSLSYYAMLSWLPTLLRDRGVSAAHAGDLLALMNLGNAVTAMLVPVLAHRMLAQRLLVVPTVLATAAGIAGALYGPLGSAWAWILLLGLAQGGALGLGIFFTMARAPDPVSTASLSGLAQGWGYLLATAGPLLVGLLHASTGGWNVPIALLIALCAVELAAGWQAAANRVLPSPR